MKYSEELEIKFFNTYNDSLQHDGLFVLIGNNLTFVSWN